MISAALFQGLSLAWGAEAPPFTVMLQAGRVSVAARDAPLGDVLGEVGQQGGFAIRLDATLESRVNSEEVTTAFRDEAVESALHRLLKVENLVFIYSAVGLVEVRGYADRSGGSSSDQTDRRVADSGDEDRVELARLQREALGNPDPDARAKALEEVLGSGDEVLARVTALEVLRRDRDEDMLARALTALSELQRVPLEPIIRFVTTSREPRLRVQALEILGENGRDDSRVSGLLLTLSRKDPDADVRESAQALLEDLSEK